MHVHLAIHMYVSDRYVLYAHIYFGVCLHVSDRYALYAHILWCMSMCSYHGHIISP
jgi:hypothetical protein